MGGGGDEDLFGPWETHYNWRRMLGYDLRRWMWLDSRLGHWGCRWEYGRSKKVAREMLDRAYGDCMATDGPYRPDATKMAKI